MNVKYHQVIQQLNNSLETVESPHASPHGSPSAASSQISGNSDTDLEVNSSG